MNTYSDYIADTKVLVSWTYLEGKIKILGIVADEPYFRPIRLNDDGYAHEEFARRITHAEKAKA